MGSRHPVPPRGVHQRDRYQPLDLIQWIYQMETDRKVRAADITVPARHKMLKIPGDLDKQSLYKPLTWSRKAFQLHPTDAIQKPSSGSRPAVGELHETKRDGVDGENRSLPSQIQDVVNSQSSDPGGGETVSRGKAQGWQHAGN